MYRILLPIIHSLFRSRILAAFIFLQIFFFPITEAQRITVSGGKFMVDGSEIFINGVNTPWDHWNDFGGSYDHSFWDSEFNRIRQAGGNATRIWITCNGDVGITINNDGLVTGATAAHWSDLDDMFALAQQHKIYIMATLISFDHTKNSHSTYLAWRSLFVSDTLVASYVNNYVIPFVNRYKDNPYLWSIDACNEIEWMHENTDNGQIEWTRLQYFVARVAAAVHRNSSILVTLGSAAVKWNSTCPGCEGNYWSDAALWLQYQSTGARLDFYSPHFYGWVVRWFGDFATEKTPADYQISDRPCMVGESPATGIYRQNSSGTDVLEVPIDQAYIKTYQNGWMGLMSWTSNGVDPIGSLADCGIGIQNFFAAYPALVDPTITGLATNPENAPGIKIYPNPTGGMITLDHPGVNNLKINFYNLTGQLVLEQYLPGSEKGYLDISSCKPGLYIMELTSGSYYKRTKISRK